MTSHKMIFIIIISSIFQPGAAIADFPYQAAQHAVVQVQAASQMGSGVVIQKSENMAWILTCRHVVWDTKEKDLATNVTVRFWGDPQTHRIRNIKCSEPGELDVALLIVEAKIPEQVKSFGLNPFGYGIGEIKIVAYPVDRVKDPKFTAGYIDGYASSRYTIVLSKSEGQFIPAESGAPIFANDNIGQIVGIVQQTDRGKNIAIPSEDVVLILKRWNLHLKPEFGTSLILVPPIESSILVSQKKVNSFYKKLIIFLERTSYLEIVKADSAQKILTLMKKFYSAREVMDSLELKRLPNMALLCSIDKQEKQYFCQSSIMNFVKKVPNGDLNPASGKKIKFLAEKTGISFLEKIGIQTEFKGIHPKWAKRSGIAAFFTSVACISLITHAETTTKNKYYDALTRNEATKYYTQWSREGKVAAGLGTLGGISASAFIYCLINGREPNFKFTARETSN